MHNPTKWEQLKDVIRFIWCHHKNTQVRAIEGGEDLNNLEVLARFEHCLDCRNDIKQLETNPTHTEGGSKDE